MGIRDGAGHLDQLGGGVPGRLDLVGGEHDLDLGGEQLDPPEPVGRLVTARPIAAASILPCASRSSASPSCGSRPHRLARW
jgi:hypothetical protein